ncbi:MAG: DUF438 domain-containing protein [Candidatus Bipolaricaulota bacterium]
MVDAQKTEALKRMILALHAGEAVESVKARFDRLIAEVSPDELAEMEQTLIRQGLPVEEIQRLCDLHVGVVRDRLQDQGISRVPAGHPLHTYMLENREFEQAANRLLEASRIEEQSSRHAAIAEHLATLAKVHIHYLRKENQLFPFLEKHGVTGPTQVMWGIHDQIRKQLRDLDAEALTGDREAGARDIASLAQAITEMIYKEEKILFPMALGKLSDQEWVEMRRGEEAVGFAFGKPPAWPATPEDSSRTGGQGQDVAGIRLATGQLTELQLRRMLTRLPVDISFVDAQDRVQFYSDNPQRVFPRTPAVIGRSVTNCHPPKSVDKVLQILDAFKNGSRNEARFWIQLGGRFIVIEYFAVRDEQGSYLGCLEVSQDATEIRSLQGESRLLDLGSASAPPT